MDLYLIRHAECLVNLKPHIIAGRSNGSDLSKRGYRQAKALKERLIREGIQFDAIYRSPAIRTEKTVFYGFPNYEKSTLYVREELQELDRGQLTGRIRAEVHTPEVLAMINKNSWEYESPGGESPKTVAKRMMVTLNETLGKTDEQTVVYVSHGVAIKCLITEILKSDKNMFWRWAIDNTSISQFHYENGIWSPIRINDAAHIIGI